MLWVWQVWLHCHGLSTQDTSFGNPSKHHKPKPHRSHHARSSSRDHHEHRDRQSLSRSQSHFHRHCSSSCHDSYRSCSRSWHRDNWSQPRSSSWCSHFTYRDCSHRSCHDTPHWPITRSSTHRSSSAYHFRDCSRSHSCPSYKSSRWDLHRSQSHSSRPWGKSHHKKKPKNENRRSTHRLLQLWWTFQWLRRGGQSFKLSKLSPSSDSH